MVKNFFFRNYGQNITDFYTRTYIDGSQKINIPLTTIALDSI